VCDLKFLDVGEVAAVRVRAEGGAAAKWALYRLRLFSYATWATTSYFCPAHVQPGKVGRPVACVRTLARVGGVRGRGRGDGRPGGVRGRGTGDRPSHPHTHPPTNLPTHESRHGAPSIQPPRCDHPPNLPHPPHRPPSSAHA
jgi:hypothetical protein